MKKFVKFDSAAVALEEAASLKDGKVSELLAGLLGSLKSEKKPTIAVAEAKLGTSITNTLDMKLTAVSGTDTVDLFRGIREHLSSLIPGLEQGTLDRMALGLSHSMSRHKLKFSKDKIDAMIVQAIKMLDDVDKELNVYAMRTKEWYGWHFPELAKTLNDNLAYARVVLAAGLRTNIAETDLTEILPDEMIEAIKAQAEMSMGTDITERDLENIQALAKQVVMYTNCRAELSSYLESRMRAIAPNLTALVGVLVGARLIAHAGSLTNLVKLPGSTIQILGAEKALFRALKTKHDTPKYGLLYHSSLIGQATGRNKGKIARMLAAKAALGVRVDGCDEDLDEKDEEERSALGVTSRIKLENRLRKLEGKAPLPRGTNIAPTGDIITPGSFSLNQTSTYNVDADGVTNELNGNSAKKSKKDKKKALIEVVEEKSDDEMKDAEGSDDEPSATPSKVAKLSEADYETLAAAAGISVSKFKRKYERGDVQVNADGTPNVISKKELKKARKSKGGDTPSKAEPAAESKKRKADDSEQEVEQKKEKKQKKKKRHSEA